MSSKKLDLVAIGASALDMVVRVKEHPRPDQIVLVKEFEEFPGGSTANVSVALARLGVRVGFVGKVGGDRFGELLLEDFRRAGVDVSRVIVEPGARSAFTFIAVDERGRKVIYSLGGKALLESPNEIEAEYLLSSRAIYLGEAYPKVVADPISSARKNGIRVIYNLGVNLAVIGAEATDLLKLCDLVISSSKDLLVLGDRVEEVARSLLKKGPRAVVVTMGREGSLLFEDKGKGRVPAFKTKVVDTTGAGDAFSAGLIFGILKGWDLLRSMRFGNAVAAIKISEFGPRKGLPTEKEVIDFLRKRGSEI